MRIDLNCDMGESFSNYKLGLDEEVIKFITSANIACGWHAGDPMVMERTVRIAVENGVGIGAHPSYPDMLGFGRRFMDCTSAEIRNYLIYQIGALKAFCDANDARLYHVKPHGALYNTAVQDRKTATAIAEAVVTVDPELLYVALAGAKGEMVRSIGQEVGLKVVYEAFPDRAYTPEGTLVSRREPGAVIKDPEIVAERAIAMAEGRVTAIDGTELELEAQTLCVHGDTPGAVDLVRSIRQRLEDSGIKVMPMGAD
ncbi:MAG TPA: LamB/YcsF family protein [Desulfobacteraceae bacterium]|nr:LamB/YcsF family protein [Desulfobacteraceae bacterium]